MLSLIQSIHCCQHVTFLCFWVRGTVGYLFGIHWMLTNFLNFHWRLIFQDLAAIFWTSIGDYSDLFHCCYPKVLWKTVADWFIFRFKYVSWDFILRQNHFKNLLYLCRFLGKWFRGFIFSNHFFFKKLFFFISSLLWFKKKMILLIINIVQFFFCFQNILSTF